MKSTILVLSVILLFGCKSVKESTSNPVEMILEVAPERVDCVGVAPQKCLKIREEGKTDWELLYNGIEGFNFTQGIAYKLKVKKTTIKNPPADGASVKYSLIDVISNEVADVTDAFAKYPTLTVTKIENGKDGYTAHLVDSGEMTYTMVVSIPNLGDDYVDLKVGDKIKADGEYAESIPIRIYVKKIKKLE